MGYKLVHFVFVFLLLTMFITIFGAGAASRYGSDQMMRLRLRNTGIQYSRVGSAAYPCYDQIHNLK
jgi:hypothetical protein